MAPATPGATRPTQEVNPLTVLGGAVTKLGFEQNPELERGGWQYVAPGVAVRNGTNGAYESVITYALITEETLQALRAAGGDVSPSAASKASNVYADALGQIQQAVNTFGRGDLNTFRNRNFDQAQLHPQDSASIGTFYRTLYGCAGSVSAYPQDPGDGAKAYADVNCGGSKSAVVEMWAAAGYTGNVVTYKAFESRNRYDLVQKAGTSYCKARSKLSVIDPGSVTIGGGVTVGLDTVVGPNAQASLTGSVTYSKTPLVTYTAESPSGC